MTSKNSRPRTKWARSKTELVELVADEFAAFRTQDIEPMKRDIATLKQDVQKIRSTFAPRLDTMIVSASSSRSSAFPVLSSNPLCKVDGG